ELIVLPLKPGTRAVLPDVPDVTDELDHLAEPRAGRGPRRRVAALVMTLHLRAEPEDEAAARRRLQVPRDLRVDERAPRERDGDVRADRHVVGRRRGGRARKVRIVAGLGGPDPVVPELLRMRREAPGVAEIAREEAPVDLHGGPLLERPR